MFKSHKTVLVIALAMTCLATATTAKADPVNLTLQNTFSPAGSSGTNTGDADRGTYNFSLASDTTLTFSSVGYSQLGGFDSVLTLFDSTGTFITDFTSPGSPGDFSFDFDLSADDYTLVITEFNNFANGSNLSNGFSRDGNPTFTSMYVPQPNPNNVHAPFVDAAGNQRNGNFLVHVTSPDSVPEPATMFLLGTGLVGLAARVRRHRTGLVSRSSRRN